MEQSNELVDLFPFSAGDDVVVEKKKKVNRTPAHILELRRIQKETWEAILAERKADEQNLIDRRFFAACKKKRYLDIYEYFPQISSTDIVLKKESRYIEGEKKEHNILDVLGWSATEEHYDCIMMLINGGCKLNNTILYDIVGVRMYIYSQREAPVYDRSKVTITLRFLNVMKCMGLLEDLGTLDIFTPILQYRASSEPLPKCLYDIIKFLFENSNLLELINRPISEYYHEGLFCKIKKTPLIHYLGAEQCNVSTLNIFVRYGLDVFALNDLGKTALYVMGYTCQEDVVIMMLNMYIKAERYDLICKEHIEVPYGHDGEDGDEMKVTYVKFEDMVATRDFQQVLEILGNMYNGALLSHTNLAEVANQIIISYIL